MKNHRMKLIMTPCQSHYLRGEPTTPSLNVIKNRGKPINYCAHSHTSLALLAATMFISGTAYAKSDKPNILFIVSDDTGYGDLGPYGGGEGRGMPTPNIDRLAEEGVTLFSFYAQPSCTPGRAAMQTGRIPNRSGMTTVAFQGQGGGLPKAEWTLASVLKKADYQTYFTGKWHMGESDYALPNAHGYDEMKYVGLYHLCVANCCSGGGG